MSERAFQEPKKAKSSSPEHNFSPINNPKIVLEISAVLEYFAIIIIRLLEKLKKKCFRDRQKGQNTHQKTMFFIFLNERITIVPNYFRYC